MRRLILGSSALLACSPTAAPRDAAAELLAADRAFARATAERGADGWAGFFADSGLMFQRRGKVEGREPIREVMRARFGSGRPELHWEPQQAVTAASGELGYTVGRWWRAAGASPSADSGASRGNYVTIWRRQRDGSWKVVVDIGNEDPPSR